MTLGYADFATYMEDGTEPSASTSPTNTQIDAFITNFEADCVTLHGASNDCATRRAVQLFIINAKHMSYNEMADGGAMRYIRQNILEDKIVLKCLGVASGGGSMMSFNTRQS